MKTTSVLVLVALLGLASALSCADGFYAATQGSSGDEYCTECGEGVAKCDSSGIT